MENFNSYKFRCSELGNLMTESRTKSETLSKTTKSYLQDVFDYAVYGIETDISNKYIEKGLEVEDEAIDLYQRVKDEMYIKNEDYFENDFICGTPDIILKDRVIDIKSPWSRKTFNNCSLTKNNEWQIRGYMELTGVSDSVVSYCLVDTPFHLIQDEQRKLIWKLEVLPNYSEELGEEACEKLERAMIFNDIPEDKRVKEFHVKHSKDKIEQLYTRIKDCREYLNSLL